MGWVKWVIGIKEGNCDEYQVLYESVESLNCTPETNITLYINYWNLNENKNKTKQNRTCLDTPESNC